MITINGVEFRQYDSRYAVSKNGDVIKGTSPYTTSIRKDGYVLCARNRLVHRMVAHSWIRPLKKGEHVHHINHNRSDNRVSNLEIITQREHIVSRHKDALTRLSRSGPSEDGKKRLRELRLGTKMPKETREKISKSLKDMGHKPKPRTGKRSAEEMAKRAYNPPRASSCIIDGVPYISFAEASRKTGVHRFTIRKRCLSSTFPNYQLSG